MSVAAGASRTTGLGRHARLFLALAVRPRDGVAEVISSGTLAAGLAGIALACAVSALDTARFAAFTSVSDLAYGSQRSPAVSALLDSLGTARTAVVVYLVEQAWTAVLAVTAIGPLFVWLLGATAVHAAARLASAGRSFGRFAVFAAYATATVLVPAGVTSFLLEGDPRSPLASLGRIVGLALLVWLGWLYFRGIQTYYGVPAARAVTILIIAVTLFYLVPLGLIAIAVVGIVVAAVVLDLA